jgi:chorismate mutase/prephenate dehydratase
MEEHIMNKILDKRVAIDEIDDQIARLYNQRMALVKEIGEEKAQSNVLLTDGDRERHIVNRVAKLVDPNLRVYAKQVFMTMFDTSKAYQSRFTRISSPLGEQIKSTLGQRLKFPVAATVACQGVEGSYSGIAAEKLFEIADVTYFKTFDGVFNSVESGLCEFGVLPIENSTAGSVNAVYDLMRKHSFHITRSVKLPVRHALLAKRGTNIKDIKEIFSHEQAIAQCEGFLKKFKDVKITVCANTAVAAKLTAEHPERSVASLSSQRCAETYDLAVLQSDVQDNDNNFTRFICIEKKLSIYAGSNKMSIMINLPHEPGSLNKLLSKFTALGLNLTKLESRPTSGASFEFLFYFDFECDIESREVLNLIIELDNRSDHFVFLGCYHEI